VGEAKKKRGKMLTEKALAVFCGQIGLILRSGINLYDGVASMAEDADDAHSKELLEQIAEQLKDYVTLHAALKSTGIFPDYMVSMVDIGEKTGRLEDVMQSLSLYYEREDRLKKRIKSAVLYPTVLVSMMAVVIIVLLSRVMPVFEQVFQDLGTSMSDMAVVLMNIGIAASKYSMIILGALAVAVAAFWLYSRTESGGAVFARLGARFPLTRRLSQKISAGRFASALSLMLSSGYDTEQALRIIPAVVPNDYVKEKISQIGEMAAGGASLAEAIGRAGIFTGLYAKMVSLGFKTGANDEVMKKIAAVYEEESEDSLNNIVSVLEPALVAVLAVVIGVILISVMLPMIGIMSAIG